MRSLVLLVILSDSFNLSMQILYLVSNETSLRFPFDKKSPIGRFNARLMQAFKYLYNWYFSAFNRLSIKVELDSSFFLLVVFTKYLSASHLASSARYSSIRGKISWTHSSKTQYELAFNRVYMCNTNSIQSWLQFKRCPT